jgi:hypothetical protein
MISYRLAKPSDEPLIFNSWVKTAIKKLNVNPVTYREYVKSKLETETTLVATDPEDDDFILGYATFNENEIFFCYVRKTFRKLGVLNGILAKRQSDYQGKKVTCAFKRDGRNYASKVY